MKLAAFPNLSPTVLLIGIAVLIILLFALILFILWRTKKKQEIAGADAPPPEAQAPEQAEEKPLAAPNRISEAQAGSSVSSAIHFLKENSAGLGGRYRTPWFLVVGASGSGKTSLLDHSGISLSLRGGATNFGVAEGIQWRFFDAGVILDVPGDFFLRADHTASDERNWKSLLRNLVKHRPQRPIDGVVVTIPATELAGDHAVSPAVIGQRASHIFDKLWLIQKWLGLCFPVYVVVTKCDLLPGFKGLASQLPARYRGEMFGWSNPYNLDTAFESGWVDQGFEELARQLNRVQSEVLVERHAIADVDDLFLFSARIQELRRPLRIYLGQIFKRSAYRESHQFRGFYFVGDGTPVAEREPESEPLRAMAAAASHFSSESSMEDYVPIPGDVLGLTSATHAVEASPIFITDLFESKIFPERGLARPVSRVHLSKNRWVVGAQAACLIAVILLGAGVWWNYAKLARAKADYVPMLDNVYEELTKMNGRDSSAVPLTAEEQDSAHYLIRVVQSSSPSRFRSIFYPTSLIAPLDRKLQEAMVPVFSKLVLVSFRQQLLKKGELLGSIAAPPASCRQNGGSSMSQLDSYQQLCGFTQDLLLLEQNIDTYNRVSSKGQGDSHEIARLEEYLSGHELPESFVDNHNPYFDLALEQASGQPIDRANVNQGAAVTLMRDLTRNFFEQWFPQNPLLSQLDDIREKISGLDEPQTAADLITLRNSLKQVKDETASPEFAWVGHNDFQLTPDLSAVTNDVINRSKYFFQDQRNPLSAFVYDVGRREFADFRARRDGERTQLTGSLLTIDSGAVQLCTNADKLRAYLDDLLKQPFAQRDQAQELKTARGSDEQLVWNKDLLQQAISFQDPYERFLKEQLAQAPPELQETFEVVAQGRLEDSMVELTAESQKLQPLPSSNDMEQSVVPELQSFQEAAPHLNSVLEQLHELGSPAYEELLKISVGQAARLLLKIDQSFEAQAPYTTSGDNFNRWNGDNTPGWAGFDAHNPDELSQYVQFQRQQVQQYSAKATPLVTFLQTRVSMGPREPGRTFAKWNGIVTDLQQYTSKVPGTSLKGLEDFIGVEIPKVSPENCQAGFLTTAATGGTYFAQRQEYLRRSLYGRCRYLSEQNAVTEYAGIAKLFNDQLAGRFPFSSPPQEQLPSEADPSDIVKLYGMLDSYEKSIRSGLQKGSFGESYTEVLAFLNQMDALRPLFGSLLSGLADAVPSFDFVPVFRVNQAREINGNEIIDWTLQVGADSFHYRDPERTGRWNFGDPVKLVLRWAKDSPQQPASVTTSNDTRLRSRTITFEYRDSWALFSMIFLHQPASNDFDRLADPDPQTLVFTVSDTQSAAPNANANDGSSKPETKVFVRIRLRPPGKPENLRMRTFPIKAPELAQNQAQSLSAGGDYQ
ncbi:MAG TPA: type VI secretion protein IcmF/TssM N-terminal domain-containing protein [Candidatus Angelobacter sp.]